MRKDYDIQKARKLAGRVEDVLLAQGEGFITRSCDRLNLDFEGICGDRHHGFTRKAGAREPWHARGLQMRNERQISIVSSQELEQIAIGMGIDEVKPEWMGANIVLDNIPDLSMVPGGSWLFFESGVTLRIEGQNAPCRFAGAAICQGAGIEDEKSGALEFVKVAKRLRGLTGWVECQGTITKGESVSLRVPEQWIYAP